MCAWLLSVRSFLRPHVLTGTSSLSDSTTPCADGTRSVGDGTTPCADGTRFMGDGITPRLAFIILESERCGVHVDHL